MGSKKGERRGGRKKGTPNKLSIELRQEILDTLKAAGGKQYLLRLARNQPELFVPLLGKCIPREIKAEITDTIMVKLDGQGVAPAG